jgi:hypothetical protein
MPGVFGVREDTLKHRRAHDTRESEHRAQQKTRRPHRDARRSADFPMRPIFPRARHIDSLDDERAVLSGA